MVEPLALPMETQWKLVDGVALILQQYLGQVLTAEMKTHYAASRHSLKRIAIESAGVAARLSGLDNEFLVAIEKHRGDSEASSDPPRFDFLHLVPILERLAAAAENAGKDFPAKSRGAPKKTWLDEAMGQFRELFDQAGLEVELRESGSKAKHRRSLGKPGGVLLLAIFKDFYPLMDETVIWGSWSRAKRKPKQKS